MQDGRSLGEITSAFQDTLREMVAMLEAMNRRSEREAYANGLRLMELQDEQERRSRAKIVPRIPARVRYARRAGSHASASSRFSGSF